jgi:hypothetical protein
MAITMGVVPMAAGTSVVDTVVAAIAEEEMAVGGMEEVTDMPTPLNQAMQRTAR